MIKVLLRFWPATLPILLGGARFPTPWDYTPPPSFLDRMEQKITKVPCIGSLNRWERQYSYKTWTTGTVFHLDQAVIEFSFYQAGKFEFKAGRHFRGLPRPSIDDRAFLFAHGFYDALRDQIVVDTCGPNVR